MLLEVEADQDIVNESGSLMDRVTAGLITTCREFSSVHSLLGVTHLFIQVQDPTTDVEESDFLGVLLRDTNASHLLEIVVSRCPQDAFDAVWKTYFKGKLARLAHHPVANFVLAKAIERVSEDQLKEIFEQLPDTWQKLISKARQRFSLHLIHSCNYRNFSYWRSKSCH
jgi:nucleolar protein 9